MMIYCSQCINRNISYDKIFYIFPFIQGYFLFQPENEDGGGTQAGLASMETLDDSNGSKVDEKTLELIRLEHDVKIVKYYLIILVLIRFVINS